MNLDALDYLCRSSDASSRSERRRLVVQIFTYARFCGEPLDWPARRAVARYASDKTGYSLEQLEPFIKDLEREQLVRTLCGDYDVECGVLEGCVERFMARCARALRMGERLVEH